MQRRNQEKRNMVSAIFIKDLQKDMVFITIIE